MPSILGISTSSVGGLADHFYVRIHRESAFKQVPGYGRIIDDQHADPF